MAWSPKPRGPEGFTTPAAVIVTMAIGVVAVAYLGRSIDQLHQEQGRLKDAEDEALLDGASASAALAIRRSEGPGPFRWQIGTTAGSALVLAEPEAMKLPLASLPDMTTGFLSAFDVADPDALKAALHEPSLDLSAVERLDASSLWRHCLRSFVSPYGFAATPPTAKTSAPSADQPPARIGAVWRIVAQSATGWVDDRIVRFMGAKDRQLDIIDRKLYRLKGALTACDEAVQP